MSDDENHLFWYDPVLGPWRTNAEEEEIAALADANPDLLFFYGPYDADFRTSYQKEKLN
jgi:hypothetical protein